MLRNLVIGATAAAGLMIGLAPGANASPIENYRPSINSGFQAVDLPCGQSEYNYSGYNFTRWNNCTGGGQKLLVHVRQFPDIERCIPAGTAEDIGGAGDGAGTVSGVEIIGGC
ncbi:hypothetical protein [Nocardia sp. NPDC057440]|uniref:hypothetical protein n=1 Tax=Nocardia sp. NPDC057440 TaxID=3346134 RepID=UPI00366E7C8B